MRTSTFYHNPAFQASLIGKRLLAQKLSLLYIPFPYTGFDAERVFISAVTSTKSNSYQ